MGNQEALASFQSLLLTNVILLAIFILLFVLILLLAWKLCSNVNGTSKNLAGHLCSNENCVCACVQFNRQVQYLTRLLSQLSWFHGINARFSHTFVFIGGGRQHEYAEQTRRTVGNDRIERKRVATLRSTDDDIENPSYDAYRKSER